MAAKHGDVESVHYLVKQAKVPVPREPQERCPAILAAHFGHHLVVRELLDALPGAPTWRGAGEGGERWLLTAWGFPHSAVCAEGPAELDADHSL